MAASDARRLAMLLSAVAGAILLAACQSTPPPRAAPLDDKLYAGRSTTTFGTQLPVANAAEAKARAAQANAKGDRDLMLYFLIKAAELDPADCEALLVIGMTHEERGNFQPARHAYELGLARTPNRRELSERLGLVDVRLGLDAEARAVLEPLTVFGDASWRVYDGLGLLDDRAGRHDAAELNFAAALERQPGSVTTLNNRGYSRLLVGDLDGAERDLRAALKVGPYGPAWTNLGRLQAQRGLYPDALDSFLHTLPKAEALERVGEAALAREDYALARDYLQRAAEASPVWFERAHVNLQVAEAHLDLNRAAPFRWAC